MLLSEISHLAYLVILILDTNSRTQFAVGNSIADQSSIHSYARLTLVKRNFCSSIWRFQESITFARRQAIPTNKSVRPPGQVGAAGKRINFAWDVVSTNNLVFTYCFEDILRRWDVFSLKMSKDYQVEVASARQTQTVLNRIFLCFLFRTVHKSTSAQVYLCGHIKQH